MSVIDQPRCYGCGSQLKIVREIGELKTVLAQKTPMPWLQCVNCERTFRLAEMRPQTIERIIDSGGSSEH